MIGSTTTKKLWVIEPGSALGSAAVAAADGNGPFALLSSEADRLDLRDQFGVNAWLAAYKPDYVALPLPGSDPVHEARCGASSFADNVSSLVNVIDGSARSGVSCLVLIHDSKAGAADPAVGGPTVIDVGVRLCREATASGRGDFVAFVIDTSEAGSAGAISAGGAELPTSAADFLQLLRSLANRAGLARGRDITGIDPSQERCGSRAEDARVIA